MDNFVLIPYKVLKEKDLSSEAITVLISILFNKKNTKSNFFISFSLLEWIIFKKSASKKFRQLIIAGFDELVKKDLVIVSEKMRDDSFICLLNEVVEYQKGIYCYVVYEQDFNKILSLNIKNKFIILKYYVFVVGDFGKLEFKNTKHYGKVWRVNQCNLGKLVGLSISTMYRYNEILVNNKVLYIQRSRKGYYNMNFFSRYADRDYCISYLQDC